jgi:hypothetical protein
LWDQVWCGVVWCASCSEDKEVPGSRCGVCPAAPHSAVPVLSSPDGNGTARKELGTPFPLCTRSVTAVKLPSSVDYGAAVSCVGSYFLMVQEKFCRVRQGVVPDRISVRESSPNLREVMEIDRTLCSMPGLTRAVVSHPMPPGTGLGSCSTQSTPLSLNKTQSWTVFV